MIDYYEILGIAPSADDAELRSAWRELAKRWHPDRAGTDTTHIFQKLLAAYTVLADPEARAAYDRERAGPRRRAPGILLRRLSRSLDALLACGIARRDGDVIELFLDADEASEGGMVTIPLRVPVRCPTCAGDTTRTILRPSALLPDMIRPIVFRARLA